MKKPFKDALAPKQKTNGKSPWSFKAPSYDRRTSSSIPAGDYYGVGVRNPVGKLRDSSMSPIPAKAKSFPPEQVV